MKATFGLMLALFIGIACRVGGIPLPAPPILIGALLVVAMTLGFVVMDRFAIRGTSTREHCGGPSGAMKEKSS